MPARLASPEHPRFVERLENSLPLPKEEGQGGGKGDTRITHALSMGFYVRSSLEGLVALSHLPFQASGFAEVADSAAVRPDKSFRVTRYLSNPLLHDSPHEDQKPYAGGEERSRGSGMFALMRIKGYFPLFKDEGEVIAGFGQGRLVN